MSCYSKAYEFISVYSFKCYLRDRREHVKAGRRVSTFRFNPDQYIRDFVDALNKGDEEKIKGMMMFPRQHPSFTSAL